MQSISNVLQSSIVIADKICDYIPLRSHYNNAICLIAKGILYGVKSYTPSTYVKIQDTHLVKHLNQKSIPQCLILCIPFLNILIAFARDFPKFSFAVLNVIQPSEPKERPKPALTDLQRQVETFKQENAEMLKRREESNQLAYQAESKEALEESQAKIKNWQDKIDAIPPPLKDSQRQVRATQRQVMEAAIEAEKEMCQTKLEFLKRKYGIA